MKPGAILATNTSKYSLVAGLRSTLRRRRLVGFDFFNGR